MTDLYLDVDKRIKKGELLPNFEVYYKTICEDLILFEIFRQYLKRKRKYPNWPFIPQEEVLLAIRNQALYGVFDPKHKQIVGLRQDSFANKTDENGYLITVMEPYLAKQTVYRMNNKILAFLADIVMETIDFVKINDAISEYYGIKKDEIAAIKDWAMKLSLLIIEPSVAKAYKYPALVYAVVENYKMNVLTCIYARRHEKEIKWEKLPGCDFTWPDFTDEGQFSKVFEEFGRDKDLESKNNEKFGNAFEKLWRNLQNFSDGQLGFKVVPKLKYDHFRRYLNLARTEGVKIDTEVQYQLINYLGFLSKINPTFGLAKAYRQTLIETFSIIARSRARIIAFNTKFKKKNKKEERKKQEEMKEWLGTILLDVVEKTIDKYDPLFFWEKVEKKDRNFVLGEIQDTTNREKFKIIPISDFVDKKIMRKLKELRADGNIRDDLIGKSIEENSNYGEKKSPRVTPSSRNEAGIAISKEELNKDKLLVIEDFAELARKDLTDSRLDTISKSNLVKRLRHWDKMGIFKPRERSRRHKIRFYHHDQIREISIALDQAGMNKRHEIEGCYSLKEAKEKIFFKKGINTFRNRISDLVRAGKLPKDVKRSGGYAFSDEQLNIIAKELA